MDTFSAVTTTGIYCRPGCSARPLPGNIRRFGAAAAAEAAGYRACLRCRPYRSPQPNDWSEQEMVCRAVQLIIDGALDGGAEADLGERLGVSARHLRRLFAAQLGATPDQLARSRRTHFARRLMDDTDMTFTAIAFASGFGSVRQLNRACLDVFHATPRELRARRRASDRLAADGGLALRLPFRGPLDWPAMLSYLRARAIPGVELVSDDVYRRTIVVDGFPGVIELHYGGSDHLVLRAHLPRWEGLIHVVERARRIFNLDATLDETSRELADDHTIGPLLTVHPGLRVPGTWDPFEIGVRAIVGQQVSVRGATTITGRIVERHGDPVPGLGQLGLTHTFPTAQALAVAELGGLGLTGARIGAIHAFARTVADGRVHLDLGVGIDRLTDSIVAIPGLGPWTAQYIALRLGERDAFPASDLGLRRALGDPAPLSTTALAAKAEAWRPSRALAAIHLWMSPQNP